MKKLFFLAYLLTLYYSHNKAAQAAAAQDIIKTDHFNGILIQSFNISNFNTKKGYKKRIKYSQYIDQFVNQDKILVKKIRDNIILVAVFDGHGQRKYRPQNPLNPELLKNNNFIKDTHTFIENDPIYYLDAGGYIADKAREQLPNSITTNWDNPDLDLQQVITKAFEEFQKELINRYTILQNTEKLSEVEKIEYSLIKNGGSTGTIALINLDTKLITIAVTGDSPAFIINQPNLQKAIKKPESLLEKAWSYVADKLEALATIVDPEAFDSKKIAIAKTADHDLQNPKERDRLSAQNGINLGINNSVYLMNLLAADRTVGVQTTRSLGDIDIHLNKDNTPSKLGIATPEIYQFTLTPEMGLLLASDGLIGQEQDKNYLGTTESEFIKIMSENQKLSENFVTLINSLNKKPKDDVSAIFVTISDYIAPEDDVDD